MPGLSLSWLLPTWSCNTVSRQLSWSVKMMTMSFITTNDAKNEIIPAITMIDARNEVSTCTHSHTFKM
jgi:hypothetical protein